MSHETNLIPNLRTIYIKGYPLHLIAPGIWRIEPTGKMRVGVHLIGSEELLKPAKDDLSIDQAMNVATLPGVIDPVLAMPDMHQGYGFPIGGVAAFRLEDGVVSPGGVGYDINCGVRLLKTPFHKNDIHYRSKMKELVADLFENIPSGVGSHRKDFQLELSDLKTLLVEGAQWALRKGFATESDLEVIEEGGCLRGANPDRVSATALERGLDQVGTLGSGNHFVEVQYLDEIYNKSVADAFGLHLNQVVVLIHTGSRGLGYQICEDYMGTCAKACGRYGIELVHKELAAAPLSSEEGRNYLSAMAAAANFAFTNRQLITYWVRRVFEHHFGITEMPLLYDVCHNIAKFEEMPVDGKLTQVCVHRKGATRAYPPNHPQVPLPYRAVGQPILIPGDMGRYSFVLVGNRESLKRSFGSACHGAGRELSRHQAKRKAKGRAILRELEDQGIYVKAAGYDTVAEEFPEAYKDASRVVEAVQNASIANLVARLRPLCVIKG
ncbi:MAG: RtcB family protein [Pseudomonadota bacterium]